VELKFHIDIWCPLNLVKSGVILYVTFIYLSDINGSLKMIYLK